MAKFRLTFKKDCGSMREGAKKGDSIVVEAATTGGINFDLIKNAVKSQLGKPLEQ